MVPVQSWEKNLALRAPAVCDVPCAADGPVDKINDGVIPSSKWCGTANSGSAYLDLGKEVDISRWIVYHANCRGAGEGVNYNTVDFELYMLRMTESQCWTQRIKLQRNA